MNRKRTSKKHTIVLKANPNAVFPLLCPVREYEWIESWKCDLIYSDSGFAEQDCIFQTEFPHDGPKDTWVVCRYEPPFVIGFIRINTIRAIRYTITLRQKGDGRTEAEWKQVVTGLNDEGDRFVSGFSDEAFRERIEILRQMLNHYLTTG